jgi:hypothetical protein
MATKQQLLTVDSLKFGDIGSTYIGVSILKLVEQRASNGRTDCKGSFRGRRTPGVIGLHMMRLEIDISKKYRRGHKNRFEQGKSFSMHAESSNHDFTSKRRVCGGFYLK